MKRFLTNHGIAVLLTATLIAVVLSLTSFFSSNPTVLENMVKTVTTPFRSVATVVTDWVTAQVRYAEEFDALKEENEQLKIEKAKLEAELRQAERDSEQNKTYRELLGLREQQRNLTWEGARVIGHDTSNWESTLTLNVGSSFGITEGDCVITAAGYLVGIITEVGTNWSTCATVIDTDSSVGAMLVRTGDMGIAQGDFHLMSSGHLTFSYLEEGAAPQVGDLLVTSGLGGYYPSQLVIGQVDEVKTGDDGLAQYATVTPMADLDAVSEVFIITDFTVVE